MPINSKTKPVSFLICFVLSLLLTKFFFLSPATKIIGDGGDSYQYLSFQNLVKENLSAFKYPLSHTNTIRYPTGFDLSYGYDGVFSIFTGAILSFFIPQPLTYNLTLVLILTLNLWCSFLFFYKLNPNFADSLIPTLIFGASPYVLARLNSHSNLAFIAGFPLLGLSVLSFFKKTKSFQSFRLTDFLFPMLSVLVIAFGSLQYLLILIYSLIILKVTLLITSRQTLFNTTKQLIFVISQNVKYFILSIFIFSLIFTYFYQGYLLAILGGHLVHDSSKVISYQQFSQPQLTDIFITNSYQGSILSKLNPSLPSIEKVISLGIIGWILLVVSLFKKPFSRFHLILFVYFIYFATKALGLFSLPLFPEGGRQIVIFSLLACSLLSLTISPPKSISVLILSLLIIERLTFSSSSTPILSLAAQKQINQLPGQALLNLPSSKYNAYYSHIPVVTNKKIVDGYFHYMADNPSANTFLSQDYLQRFFCQLEKPSLENYQITTLDTTKTLNLLKENDIRTILFHKNSKFYFDGCTGLRRWWYSFNPETLSLNNLSQGLQVKNFEIIKNPLLNFRLFAQNQGILTIHGLLIYPNTLTDTYLSVSQQSHLSLPWVNDSSGIKTDQQFFYSQTVNAGDSIYIRSAQPINETIYLTIWYTFDSTDSNIPLPLPIQSIYEDSDVRIYKIN